MADDDRDALAALAVLERRLAVLEAAVRALADRLDDERGGGPWPTPGPSAVGTSGREALVPPTPRNTAVASSAPAAASAARAAPASVARAPRRDWEALVGRYGMLVLATVTALAAVGTFIGWAIAHGWLGPTQRVVLGLVAALVLGVVGLRMRSRERSFGDSLVGLALAVTHVCAWGAGPALHIVPDWVAFVLAAGASIALAVFAHLEDDEPLWSVGFFGVAVAPFVTSSRAGNLVLLSAYGLMALGAGGYALADRPWRVANRLFLLAAAMYAAALALGAERDFGPLLALWFPLAVAYAGVWPWSGGWNRRERLRVLGVLTALASVRAGLAEGLPVSHATHLGLIAAAGLAWLALVVVTHAVPADRPSPEHGRVAEGDWTDAGIVPALIAVALMVAVGDSSRERGAALAAAAAVLLAINARFQAGALRDASVAVGVLCAVGAEMLFTDVRPLTRAAALSLVGASCFAGNRWRPSGSWVVLGLAAQTWAMLAALGHLSRRPRFAYTPFLTSESAVAGAILAAALAAWRLAREPQHRRLLLGGAVVWGFVCVHQEIAFAVSRTVSTLLRVTYYAVTSVAAVGIGRARGIAILRHAGLGLGIVAAATALLNARRLGAIGARITADLVAAAFLLAIAYWYRRPGVSRQDSDTTGPQSSRV